MRTFISRVSEEAKVAAKLIVERDFLGLLKVYVSSDGESIVTGEDWFKSLDKTLREIKVLMILCSPISIHRPWIKFELGAAWILQVLFGAQLIKRSRFDFVNIKINQAENLHIKCLRTN